MAAEPVDVLIIGGGITGAGVARDAALRGLRVALVDKSDVAGGTSSRSSRLIHGGIRYLEHGDLRLVFEASRERRTLLRIAPHLVRPLPFLFPAYRGARVPPWKLRAGLWLYDLLAAFRNVHTHRWLGAKQVRAAEPGLRDKDLTGAGLYYDAQTDDARLALATLRSAATGGAFVASYAEVVSLARPDGRIAGASVRDGLTGRRLEVRAGVVVNATGPWVDAVRRLDDPAAAPLLRLSKGAHVAVPRTRIGNTYAVTLTSPIDGRVMFVLPWGDLSYIGTTETEDSVAPERVRATGDDVVYLLRSANAFFPRARLAPHDVVSTWAGLRPLLAPDTSRSAGAVSREHRVVESPSGLVTIAGGKLTTYRVMGRDVIDRVLPGGETADLDVLISSALARGVGEPTAKHLVASYGTESAAVLNLVDKQRALGKPILEGRPEIRAEVVHAVQREMALRLADVLIRRTHLFYQARGQAVTATAVVADLMGPLLGWDEARRAEEIELYLKEVEASRRFLKE
ncbi:MAG: hypothetical protein AUG10_06050 [Gemmatimonadetes bacterium 13_1_20CM_2_70_10]|nr:MAG: hypothetical protein AUG10_06050 [Gemmatimonadetes bacterium 13_1_20CM_2_70_10]